MSILVYTGLPGSGKTYDVVANQIMPALSVRRVVVTNVPMHREEVESIIASPDLREFDTGHFVELASAVRAAGRDDARRAAAEETLRQELRQVVPPGCLLVLDEVWRLWPAGVSADKVPEPFKALLAEHRHMVDADGDALQVVLVTQELAQISKFARDLVETTFHHTKMSHVGASGSYRCDVFQGAVSGDKLRSEPKLREIFGKYDPAIFKLYRSHTMSQASGSGANERALDGRANIWHRPMLYVGLAGVAAAAVWGIPRVKDQFTPDKPVTEAVAVKRKESGQLSLAGGLLPVAPRGGASERVAWWVAGYMRPAMGAGGKVVLTNGQVDAIVSFERFCLLDVDLGPVCQWEGQEVTLYSAAGSRPARALVAVAGD